MIPPFSVFRQHLKHLSAADGAVVEQAYALAIQAHEGQVRGDGSPYVTHVIEVARIVADWHGDRDTIVAALLHDTLEDTALPKAEIVERFGKHVGLLVEAVTKFTQADFTHELSLDSKIETLRKLFEVMRRDMRAIVIKLADRLHNIRTIATLPSPERRRRFAQETMDVYCKLATHLGMRQIRRQMADVCVPILLPGTGETEKALRDQLVRQSEERVAQIRTQLDRKILVSIFCQPRNLSQFHERLMGRPSGEATPPNDASFIIAIARTESDCYQLLHAFHTLFQPVSGAFRDSIATPNETGYRSIHTAVILPDGTLTEVRIRTQDMQDQAEYGVVLSLFDQGNVAPHPSFTWLTRSGDIDLQTREDSGAFWEALESDILRESIMVTVDRRRLSLPKGATALDAAYAFYGSDAGKTIALSLHGLTIPPSHIVHDEDDIHVVLDDAEHVTFDWLEYVSTRFARTHIVEVLKRSSRTEKMTLGAALLQKEMDYYKKGLLQDLRRGHLKDAAQALRRDEFDDVLAMIGEGTLRSSDVLFQLFPEERKAASPVAGQTFSFRLLIRGVQDHQQILSNLAAVARQYAVDISGTAIRFQSTSAMFALTLSGSCADRQRFADFMHALERQDAISSVQLLLPRREKFILTGSFLTAFLLILVDVLLLPNYEVWFASLTFMPRFALQMLPLLPILVANYFLLDMLRHYVVRMRTDRWFLGVGFLFNIIGLMLVLVRLFFLKNAQGSLLPLLMAFVVSLMYVGYRFFQTEALFAAIDTVSRRRMSKREWASVRRRKIAGYLIRLVAVLIWGLEPIAIKYTAAGDLSPFLRTFLIGIGVIVPSLVYVFLRSIVVKRQLPSLRLSYDRYFVLMVIGQIGFVYFLNTSLLYTSGTNLLLFNNFSPLISLLIAAVFWRREIAYFRQPKNMLWIFLLAFAAGMGSSLLMYNTTLSASWTILGDILAMIAMFFDVLLVIGQIEYIRRNTKTDGALLNIHIFFFLLLLTAPVVIGLMLGGFPLLSHLTMQSLLFSLSIGMLIGVGQMLNYEAFKRIDGYLAYMMFNISVLVSFVIEVFVLHSVRPTPLLLLSGVLIVAASVVAEYINSQAQKRGL